MNTTGNRADMTMRPAPLLALLLWLPLPAAALELSLPSNAKELSQSLSDHDSIALPTGPYTNGTLPMITAEGQILRQSWRSQFRGTTLQFLVPLRAQVLAQGYELTFECDDDVCGGFDFRFGIDVIAPPLMHVDLFDYRYFSAQKSTPQGTAYVTLLVSRANNTGFVQLTAVTPQGAAQPSIDTTNSPSPATATPRATLLPDTTTPLPLAEALETRGHMILRDLTFATGSSSLDVGRYTSLANLAAYLIANPTLRVALVGHTDSQGTLDNNIALSKRRAASVVERLVSTYSVPRAQLSAEGMGYLSPLTSNRSVEGRDLNRRVEVILLNTD